MNPEPLGTAASAVEKSSKKPHSSKRSKKSKIAPDLQASEQTAADSPSAGSAAFGGTTGAGAEANGAGAFASGEHAAAADSDIFGLSPLPSPQSQLHQPSLSWQQLDAPSAADTQVFSNPFKANAKLSAQPSVDNTTVNGTVELAYLSASSRPSSPEKSTAAARSSKKHSKKKHRDSSASAANSGTAAEVESSAGESPNKKRSSEKLTKSSSKEIRSSGKKSHKHPTTSGVGAHASSKSPVTQAPHLQNTPQAALKEAKEPIDEQDPTGSMRFAAPSKFARQNPALLMQQPSRVLQKLVEEQQQKDASGGERKLCVQNVVIYYIVLMFYLSGNKFFRF